MQAHDEQDECNIGDTVRIHLCRPLSKRKSWTITEILHRAKVFDSNVAKNTAATVAAATTPSQAQQSRGFAASALGDS